MSFAMHLAGQLHLLVNEPPDAVSAQALVTTILKDRHAFLILDNAVNWKDLIYMLPTETCSAILVTTRNREMYDRLRLQFSGLQVHEIPLEKFTEKEALELFQQMFTFKERLIFQLEEAMNLHKKEEKIFEELGNRAKLDRSWWDQGRIYIINKIIINKSNSGGNPFK